MLNLIKFILISGVFGTCLNQNNAKNVSDSQNNETSISVTQNSNEFTKFISMRDLESFFHRKSQDICQVTMYQTQLRHEDGSECQNMSQICESGGFECNRTSSLSKSELELISPKLLVNIANNCDAVFSDEPNDSPSMLKSWLINFSLVTLINLLSVTGIWMYAAFKQGVRQKILLYFMSFGAGVLNANGLVHLLPGAYGFDPAEDTKYVWKSIVCLSGVFSFIMLDSSFKIFSVFRRNRFMMNQNGDLIMNSEDTSDSDRSERTSRQIPSLPDRFYSPVFLYPGVASYALLIIVGDACHNFLDGLAIGSSFASSHKQGYTTFLAVASEELPQEIGDFCALVFAGFNPMQALFWNLMSSLSCYLGAFFGMMFGQNPQVGYYIDAYCGGMFIYISLHGILPEVVSEIVRISENKTKVLIRHIFFMLLSIFCGMTFMVIMAFISFLI